jgi:hypothetical protein
MPYIKALRAKNNKKGGHDNESKIESEGFRNDGVRTRQEA